MSDAMIKWKMMVIFLVVLIALGVTLCSEIANASGDECIDNSCNTYNYYDSEPGTTLTAGLSDSEIAELLTIGVAAGSHQFDFSTQDWQGSVTGAFYDGEDAVSFGIGKRWDKFGKVLMHGSYTQKSGEDLWVVGGTFRF